MVFPRIACEPAPQTLNSRVAWALTTSTVFVLIVLL
jgi:hypothetical protein